MCLESGHCDSLYLIRTYVYTRTTSCTVECGNNDCELVTWHLVEILHLHSFRSLSCLSLCHSDWTDCCMRTYIRTLVTLDTLGSIPYRNVCCNTTLLVCCCTGWSPACLVFLNNRYRNCVTLLSVDFLLNILNEVNNFLVVSLNFYRVIIICAVLPALWNIYLNVCCSTGIDCVVVHLNDIVTLLSIRSCSCVLHKLDNFLFRNQLCQREEC